MLKRITKQTILLAGVPCAALFTWWALLPGDRLLIPRSSRVASVAAWSFPGRFGPSHYYGWISDHEILHTCPRNDRIPNWGLARLDLDTGHDTPVARLDDQLLKTQGHPWGWRIAPDGRHVSWFAGQRPRVRAVRAGIDGASPQVSMSRAWSSFWLDADHWMTTAWHSGSGQTSPKPQLDAVILPASAAMPKTTIQLSPRMSREAAKQYVPMSAAANRLFMVAWTKTRDNHDATELLVESLRIPPESPRSFPLRFPVGWQCLHFLASPSGRQIAWLMLRDSQTQFSQWLSQRIPWLAGGAPPQASLWVSAWDGSNLRELGHVYERPGDYFELHEVLWVPGERRISYIDKGTLYTIKAD